MYQHESPALNIASPKICILFLEEHFVAGVIRPSEVNVRLHCTEEDLVKRRTTLLKWKDYIIGQTVRSVSLEPLKILSLQ